MIYSSTESELSIDNLPTCGQIPPWLEGTLIRNGPAGFEANGKRVDHWFDGLAILEGFTFSDGKIAYVNRFLRSDQYNLMMEKGSCNFTGFGNSQLDEQPQEPEEQPLHIHNANVNVAKYGENYLALTETPLPVKFDIKTLQTIGTLDYDDPLPSSQVFESAHPEYDPQTGEQINFFIQFGPTSTYTIYKIPPNTTTRQVICEIPSHAPSYMHSFSITENYIILAEYPLQIDCESLMQNPQNSFLSHFKWNPQEDTVFTIVNRQTGEVTQRCKTTAFFSWHHVNAYEKDHEIILDLITSTPPLPTDQYFEENAPNNLVRFHLDITDGSIHQEILYQGIFEMPWIREDLNGKQYRYAYAINDDKPSSDPSNTYPILKIDTQTRSTKEWSYFVTSP